MNEARVVIESEAGLTKYDQMIYVQLCESSHIIKIGIASNDLIGHKFACVVWELPDQISQAARIHQGYLIATSLSLHHHTLGISLIQGCLRVGIKRVDWKRLWHGSRRVVMICKQDGYFLGSIL
jgi:hypothetical protein